MSIRIAVIGGASSYTPELLANLIDLRGQLEFDQIVLMDPDSEKLAFIVGVCERLLRGLGPVTKVLMTQDRQAAISGSDFVILQFRVGGLAARVRDERLPMEFGMVGNETTGPGGFVSALRTVPVALQIAQDVERLAPGAWLLNLTNPAGIVTEALLKHSPVRTVGFCNIPINTTYALAEVLGVDADQLRIDYFGLNHLSWVRGAYTDGKEVLQPLIAETRSRDSALYQHGVVDSLIDPDWLRTLGMIPGWYLRYFYHPEEVLGEDRRSLRSDGQRDMEAEKQLRDIYSAVGYGEEAQRILQAKGGAQYYLPVLQVVDSIVHDRGEVVVVDTRNGEALPDLPADVCVEVPARIGRESIEPLPVGPMPLSVRGLVQAVKTYEGLTVEAALTGNGRTAIEALMAHPLVGSYGIAKSFLERALENERPYLPRFFENRA